MTFIDNDDYLDPDYIACYLESIKENDYDVVCGGYRRPRSDGSIKFEISLKEGTDWAPFIVGAAWGKLYKTDFVRRNGFSLLTSINNSH